MITVVSIRSLVLASSTTTSTFSIWGGVSVHTTAVGVVNTTVVVMDNMSGVVLVVITSWGSTMVHHMGLTVHLPVWGWGAVINMVDSSSVGCMGWRRTAPMMNLFDGFFKRKQLCFYSFEQRLFPTASGKGNRVGAPGRPPGQRAPARAARSRAPGAPALVARRARRRPGPAGPGSRSDCRSEL